VHDENPSACLRRPGRVGQCNERPEGCTQRSFGPGLMAIGYPRSDSRGRSQFDHDVGKRWVYRAAMANCRNRQRRWQRWRPGGVPDDTIKSDQSSRRPARSRSDLGLP
jgi:hypothetical protein